MSIFETTPIQPTVQDTLNSIKGSSQRLYQMITNQHKNIFNQVWKNPNFTPQEIFTALGTDGVALVQLSSSLQTLLKTADPNYEILLPSSPVNVNADGTITVG